MKLKKYNIHSVMETFLETSARPTDDTTCQGKTEIIKKDSTVECDSKKESLLSKEVDHTLVEK